MIKYGLRLSLAFLLALAFLAVTAAPALAYDARGGDVITIAADETVNDDLYLAGRSILIEGTVNGDIFGGARTLTINGTVNGGVTFVGETLTLNGEISESARFAGAEVFINGDIGRDLVVTASEVTINEQSVISGDLILGAGVTRVNGQIGGDVMGGADTIIISGTVDGSVQVELKRLTLAPDAEIGGDLVYTSDNEANILSGATVSGTTTRNLPERDERAWPFLPVLAGLAVVWKILSFLMILLLGILLIILAGGRLTAMSDYIQSNPWHSLWWGIVIFVVAPAAAVLAIMTVVGLPLGLISLALYGMALYLSQVPVALLIGRLIIRQNRPLESRGMMIGALALGLFVLFLLGLIPFAGWIIGLLTIIFGLGTLVAVMPKKEYAGNI